MNFQLSVSPKQGNGIPDLTLAAIEPTNSGLDQPLLYRQSYEPRQEQVVGDKYGNCSNENVKYTINIVPHGANDSNKSAKVLKVLGGKTSSVRIIKLKI